MAGKKLQLTEKQIGEVEPLGAVLNLDQLSDYFGITQNTFRRMCEDDPRILEAYKKGKARAIRDVAGSLLSKARNGDKSAQMFYLKTQAGWRETTNINQTTMHLTADQLEALSTNELETLKRIYEKVNKNTDV